jgi:hypothetical protein
MGQEKKYKVIKYLPIPEVPKPLPHHKGKRKYVIEERYTKEYRDKRVEEYLKEIEKIKANDWSPRYGKKYVHLKDAEKALLHFLKQQRTGKYLNYLQRAYEFQIREIEDDGNK